MAINENRCENSELGFNFNAWTIANDAMICKTAAMTCAGNEIRSESLENRLEIYGMRLESSENCLECYEMGLVWNEIGFKEGCSTTVSKKKSLFNKLCQKIKTNKFDTLCKTKILLWIKIEFQIVLNID